MRRYGIDATIISSQKGLCLAPGLSMIILSRRIITDKIEEKSVNSLYFDFQDYIQNIKRGQTPFTPCVGVLFELHDMLSRIIKAGGADSRVGEVRARCEYFRSKIEELPVHLPPFPMSNAISPIRF